jgi:hydroxymethylglutaryl-CoA lyase
MVPAEGKLALVQALWDAGLRSIESTSFVSPSAVPQMADAERVMAGIRVPSGCSASALVPNLRGLDRAVACGAQEIAVVLAATETMNQRNIRMSLEEAIGTCEATLGEARRLGIRTRAYIAVAFACPFEGSTPPAQVDALAQAMAAAGAQEVVIADTIGAASPQDIESVLQRVLRTFQPSKLGLHLHDTRGMAVANAWQGLQMGIRSFDASVGGLGGCPFAPGAAGNLATEDLAVLCAQTGYKTGIDLPGLIEAVDLAGSLVGYPVGGRSIPWLRKDLQRRSML